MLTRFAPSPTGYLHVGNIRTALVCYLYACSCGGKLLLRFDDTDVERSNVTYIDSIIEDLKWLGIETNLSFKQSERFERYNEIFSSLMKEGHIYACYESKEELDIKRKMQLKQGLPPIYDRSSLTLSAQQKEQYERKPYFRFKLDENAIISWNDEVRGEVKFLVKNISDPIIKRTDGSYTYMLPSTIDDIDYNITHVIRGEDHITNTAVQIHIINVLKAKVPKFAHLSLLHMGEDKISKRKGGLNIRYLKEDGLEPMAINSYLAKIGTSDVIKAQTSMKSLVESFSIQKFSAASVKFDLSDIYRLNAKILSNMSFESVKERLSSMQSSDFWYLIRDNIEKFSETEKWWKVCTTNIKTVIIDQEFIKLALSLLPEEKWDENTWIKWIELIMLKTKIKRNDLFMQLRLALTGLDKGPSLAKLLPLIGKERVILRLGDN
ncbi:MAG: glutamate--tRNA ligase 1 [Candidatus Mesenet longicola]|uniref:Glutamate--tRNA ligase n=1 Tax=Candidatus Mesenet longicola TaxID=1892558 RepID=A0A8J3HNR5_9RICK|nr:MAG: glutamate--tRNA ligase 1 [Candidatus Mesenet longicola]GHM59259.1 MAG: glutamate--tRNA ligase 1 [Candidatus Mesenet longicola]